MISKTMVLLYFLLAFEIPHTHLLSIQPFQILYSYIAVLLNTIAAMIERTKDANKR